MKQLFTLLLFLFLSYYFNAQDFDNLSPESIEDFYLLGNQPKSSVTQVDLRNPFVLDSAYFYTLPDDVLEQKKYFTYNDLGSLLSDYTIKLNLNTNVWENFRKVESVRDANDEIIMRTFFKADPNTLEWVPDFKYDYTFDANGNQIQFLLSNLNNVTSSFDQYIKWDSNFDGDNILIDRDAFIWNNANWENYQYTSYIHNSDGLLLEETFQFWLLNTFNNNNKRIYEYDMDNNLIRRTNQVWDAVYLTWNNSTKLDYIFVNDVLVAEYTYQWSPSDNDWENSELTQSSYDGNGNIIENRYSSYNHTIEMWEENQRWVYFYSELDTPTEMPENTRLTCYLQNPIRTGEIINCQNLDMSKNYNLMLFDVSGKVLLEKNFKGDVEIELPSFLESGMYFMNVLQEGKLVLKEKVVVID